MTVKERPVTLDEFEAYIALPENRERRFELIFGGIVEKPMPTQEYARIAVRIAARLFNYAEARQLGFAEVEARYRVGNDPDNDRLPDISFVADAHAPAVKKGPATGMPDLAVEIKSPDDKLPDLRAKAEYYIANGTRLVWLVYPEERIVEIFRADGDVQLLTVEKTLDGGDVLPGFRLPVADVFKVGG